MCTRSIRPQTTDHEADWIGGETATTEPYPSDELLDILGRGVSRNDLTHPLYLALVLIDES